MQISCYHPMQVSAEKDATVYPQGIVQSATPFIRINKILPCHHLVQYHWQIVRIQCTRIDTVTVHQCLPLHSVRRLDVRKVMDLR